MAPRQRRAVIASRIYEPEGGAAAFRLAALAQALTGAGYDTTVLTSRPPDRTKSTTSVRRWPVLRDRAGAVRGYVQYASFDVPLLFRLLSVAKPDVVVVEPPPTTGAVCRIVCALRRVPYVYFSADVATTAAAGIGVNRLVVGILRRMERWVLRGARLVLAVSEGVRDEVISLGANPERVAVVGTGVDTNRFSPVGERPASDYPYFVYAGTMSEIQGAKVFIDAFARIMPAHPSARLIMLGQGVELDNLKRAAREQADARIEFHGMVSGDQVAAQLRGACAGLASIRPQRGYDFAYATKAYVSVSCGTPVIYSGVGPVRRQIRENNLGWAVDWDVEQVAQAMEASLATNRSQSERNRLSDWAHDNTSLVRVGSAAVEAINLELFSAGADRPADDEPETGSAPSP